MLLHCEGTNNDTDMDDDSRVGHHFEFKGNSKLSSTQKKFGSTSLFTGTSDNDHVLVDSDDTNFLELGTGDFTLECWFKHNASTAGDTQFISWQGAGGNFGWESQGPTRTMTPYYYHGGYPAGTSGVGGNIDKNKGRKV